VTASTQIAESAPGELLEHLFRHLSGRMTAHVTRLLGSARLDLAEEIVQESMLRALQTWPYQGTPENPAGWLFRTARHAALDVLRHEGTVERLQDAVGAAALYAAGREEPEIDFDAKLSDDELSMIFMCCHPEMGRDARVALSLKIAGGFSAREIARAFLTEEATIAQRLVRAKRQIRERGLKLEVPRGEELKQRLESAMEVLYFIFNEGYAAHEGEDLIRRDLCFEALRLGCLLALSPIAEPRVHALVAVMAFQAARLPARVDAWGELVLLEDQDPSQWDRELIAIGFHHFDCSMEGAGVSEYHMQAAIAATHIRGGGSADWGAILELYDELLTMNGSSIVALNRAVAVAKVRGVEDGLAALEPLRDDPALRDYHLLPAVRGHFLLQRGRREEAAESFRAAMECRCSEPERRFLQRKLGECAR
jgi:RNA polymerase sigma-70 factor (ECF subfamily)